MHLNWSIAWLNNCVGHGNHRYFFMYMAYMVVGVLFIIIGGFDIAYSAVWLAADESDEPELEGHPVKYNKTGSLVPVVCPIICNIRQNKYRYFSRLTYFT